MILQRGTSASKAMKKMILPRGTSASKASAAMDPADAPDT